MSNFTVLSVYSLFLNFYCNEYLKKITCSRLLKIYRSSRPEVFCEKGVLRNIAKFTGKHLYQSFYLNKVATLWKRDSGTGVLCEFWEISKNTFFYRTPLVAAPGWFFIWKSTKSNIHLQLMILDTPGPGPRVWNLRVSVAGVRICCSLLHNLVHWRKLHWLRRIYP